MENQIFQIVQQMNLIHALHRVQIHSVASDKGLYFGQMPILQYVYDHPGCTQRDIVDFLKISAPSIATSVKRMQKTGLLQKEADAQDLRCNRLSVTERGDEMVKSCRFSFAEVDARMFKGFSQEEEDTVYGYFERMIENLSGTKQADPGLLHTLIAQDKALHEKREK